VPMMCIVSVSVVAVGADGLLANNVRGVRCDGVFVTCVVLVVVVDCMHCCLLYDIVCCCCCLLHHGADKKTH
jgi:hypothetical protein